MSSRAWLTCPLRDGRICVAAQLQKAASVLVHCDTACKIAPVNRKEKAHSCVSMLWAFKMTYMESKGPLD